jgi:hypothetical protein
MLALGRSRTCTYDFLSGTETLIGIMRQTQNLAIPSQSESALRSLAEVFPSAAPVCISALVNVAREICRLPEEGTVIDSGASTMVSFESHHALELRNTLHLENSDWSQVMEAGMVAIRDGLSHNAIAAHFAAEVRNWIVQG